MDLRLRIERRTSREDRSQIVHRFLARRHRARIALFGHPTHVVLRRSLQPNRGAVRQQDVEGAGIGDHSARRRDHRLRIPLDRRVQRSAFIAAERGLAVQSLDFADALRLVRLRGQAMQVAVPVGVGAMAAVMGVEPDRVVALCAEAVGCMDAINAATLEYIKTRKQFGVPIGKFQVLQHRMVDCFTNAQEARSMTLMASLKIDDKDPIVRRKAASGAKVQIGKSGKFCGQSAVQMHGGMGVTDELSVSHYFKRLTMIDLMFGNQQHHLTRYSNLAMAA